VGTKRIAASLGRRLDPPRRYGARVVLFALAVVLLLGPFGLLVTELTTTDPHLNDLDLSAAEEFHPVVADSPGLVIVLEVISFIGSPPWFYLLLGGSAVYLWIKKRRRLSIFIVVTGLMGGVVDTAVKIWVDRPRPHIADPVATAPENAFPSGHTMMSTISYGVLLLVFLPLVPRRFRIPALIGALLLVWGIGFARLMLGVHFITDVVGGFLLGIAWLIASTAAFGFWQTEEGKKPVEPFEGVDPESIKSL
jgi:membrane-associated phospholipid phosphatase